MVQDIPVYLFTGFLESGKTKFIQETMEDDRFNSGERTLLLVCEEGIEEYDFSAYPYKNVYLETVENEADLTPMLLETLAKKHRAERAVVEYNGMWMLDSFYQNMPDNWAVYQEVFFVDANTFLNYNANMRNLVVDKLKSCEMIVFNRAPKNVDQMEFHKIVRAVSRKTQIAYEFVDGERTFDEIKDPLPFDINAPVIEIKDEHFAEWFRDLSEEQDKYIGRTVKFKGKAQTERKRTGTTLVVGRPIMTCCAADTAFYGFVCLWPDADKVKSQSWVTVTAKIELQYHKAYGGKGPVMVVSALEAAEAPEEEVATFY